MSTQRVRLAGRSISKQRARELARMSETQLWAQIFALDELCRVYGEAMKQVGRHVAHERVVKHWATMAMQCRAELIHRGLL